MILVFQLKRVGVLVAFVLLRILLSHQVMLCTALGIVLPSQCLLAYDGIKMAP